jgi:hypothetical protein
MTDCLNVIRHLPDFMQEQARMLKILPREDVLAILRKHTMLLRYSFAALHDGDIVLWRARDDRFHISRYSAMNQGFLTYGEKGFHLRPARGVYDPMQPHPEWIVRIAGTQPPADHF